MPSLPDEKKRAIRDIREYGFSKVKTADALGVSQGSVAKYEPDDVDGYDESLEPDADAAIDALSEDLVPANVLDPEWVPDDVDPATGESFTGDHPKQTPLADNSTRKLRVQDDYTNVTPGDFLRKFFEEFEVGVRESFVRMQSRRAERRGQLPDEEKMRSDLNEMSSGISNDTETRYIAEEYWAEAQQYLSETDIEVNSRSPQQNQSGGGEGDFVGVGENEQQDGMWMQMPDGTYQYGTYQQAPNGAQMFQPMQPPAGASPPGQQQMGRQMQGQPRQPQQSQQQGVPDPQIEEIRSELRDLRREAQSESGSSLKDQVEEFAELQSTIESLSGEEQGAANDEAISVLRNELRGLRSEIQSDAGQAGPSSSKEAAMQKALQSDDVDANSLLEIAQQMDDDKDPEVRKKELELQQEKQRMEMKRDRTENLLSGAEKMVERLGTGIGEALSAGGEGKQQGQQQNGSGGARKMGGGAQQGATQADQAPSNARANGSGGNNPIQTMDCGNCGEETTVDTRTPGYECEECQHAVEPCPECHSPIDIPPLDEVDTEAGEGPPTVGCSECGEVLEIAPAEPTA